MSDNTTDWSAVRMISVWTANYRNIHNNTKKCAISYSLGESMETYPSIFQTEINAVGRYAQTSNNNYPKQSIASFSDTQAAIKALSFNSIKSKIVWECPKRLNNLGQGNRVALCEWVPTEKNSKTGKGRSEHLSGRIFLVCNTW